MFNFNFASKLLGSFRPAAMANSNNKRSADDDSTSKSKKQKLEDGSSSKQLEIRDEIADKHSMLQKARDWIPILEDHYLSAKPDSLAESAYENALEATKAAQDRLDVERVELEEQYATLRALKKVEQVEEDLGITIPKAKDD